jgi:hypothetical protein
MEQNRVIINKSPIREEKNIPLSDSIPPPDFTNEGDESALGFDKIQEEILGIKEELKDIIPAPKVIIPKEVIPSLNKNIVVNNKVNAITNLISAIGEIRYKFSHLYDLISIEAPIEDIKSNWLVLGTRDDEGNIIPEQVELRKEEFSLFIKQ